MLNKSERFRALKFLRFCSKIGPLPTQVDLTSWKLSMPSLIKECVCAVTYGCDILHSLYLNGSLAYAFFFVPHVPLYQLLIHTALATGSIMVGSWYYLAYVKDPALFATYVKATLTGNVGGPPDTTDELKPQWTSRFKEYSIQDLVAVSMPYLVGLSLPVIASSFVYGPSMNLLLYAALPIRLQHWTTFWLLMVEEARFLLQMYTIVAPIWQLQVIAFDLVCKQLQLMMQRIENNMQSPRNVYRTLRTLQFYVSMLNNVNRYMIYTWKLLSMFVCIVSGYAAIAHFHEHPIFGFMYYFLLIDCAFIYTVIYEKAFKIPQMLDQAASCALLRNRRGRTDVLRRQILSIRRTGIKVGDFHLMERASTLIFMDYVVRNIVSMLVAFR